MSASKAHCLKVIENKVRQDLDGHINKLLQEECADNIDDLIDKMDLTAIQEEMVHKLEKNPPSHNCIWSDFNMDYGAIIDSLNGNSTIAKLKALDELLNMQIVDTKDKYWPSLSQSLKKCFTTSNADIFTRTLRIHHRIISFPNTCIDGYISLLQGTLLLLNSRLVHESNNRIKHALQLILEGQNIVIRSLLHTNHKLIEELVSNFIAVISLKLVIQLICSLDRRAMWLTKFCYGSVVRSITVKHIKHSNFTKLVVTNFVNYLNNKSQMSDIDIQATYVLSYLLSYKTGCNLFPLQLHDNETIITLNSFLELAINKINEAKNAELADMVISIFESNPCLLTSKLLNLLPLSQINKNNVAAELETHLYAVRVIENCANSNNFGVLFGNCNKLRRPKTNKTVNTFQKVVDLTVMLLELYARNDNLEPNCVIFSMLQCVLSLYKSHSVAFYYIDPSKLITNLCDFYWLKLKFNNSLVDELIALFYGNYSTTAALIGCDKQILGDLFILGPNQLIISRIANDKTGFDFLKNNYNVVVKPYLDNIWHWGEQNDDLFEEALIQFLTFLFGLKFSFKAIVAFLSHDDNEGTIVNGEKTVNLAELLERTLNCGDFAEEYLGLLAMKVLMANLDLMVYLQANYQMQDNLEKLQRNSCLENSDVVIVDANTSLRHNLLNSLRTIGFVGTNLDRNILEQTRLQECCNFDGELPQIDSQIAIFLKTNHQQQRDFGWVLQARRVFKSSLTFIHPFTFIALLDQFPKTYVYRKTELTWPPPDSVYYQLYPEDFSGISTIVNYGLQRKLLSSEVEHKDNLALLIRQSRAFLGHRPEEFDNFDWFVGVMYLIGGNFETCKSALINFSNTQATALIWSTFGKEFDSPLQDNFYQQMSIVLEENCQCFQALKILGLHPEIVLKSWLNQCFFNLLSMEEICNFLAFSVLYPPECLIYYAVALFQHLRHKVFTVTHTQTIDALLQVELGDFKLINYIDLIETLMKKYRNVHKL